MAKRVIRAGVLGGIAMYIWSSLAHVVLPLGQIGIREIPNERPVLAAMQSSVGLAPGIYLFPGLGVPENASSDERKAAMGQYDQKLAANPSGILVYHPPGAKALTPRQLIVELVSEILEALFAVFLLSLTRLDSFGSRMSFVLFVGIIAAMTTNIAYWNWYGFTASYTVAYMATQIIGFAVAGAVAAALIGESKAVPVAAA
jgi:hypothetical protein